MPDTKGPERKPPGPDPDRLKINDMTWEEAVRKSLKKPPERKTKAAPRKRRRK